MIICKLPLKWSGHLFAEAPEPHPQYVYPLIGFYKVHGAIEAVREFLCIVHYVDNGGVGKARLSRSMKAANCCVLIRPRMYAGSFGAFVRSFYTGLRVPAPKMPVLRSHLVWFLIYSQKTAGRVENEYSGMALQLSSSIVEKLMFLRRIKLIWFFLPIILLEMAVWSASFQSTKKIINGFSELYLFSIIWVFFNFQLHGNWRSGGVRCWKPSGVVEGSRNARRVVSKTFYWTVC